MQLFIWLAGASFAIDWIDAHDRPGRHLDRTQPLQERMRISFIPSKDAIAVCAEDVAIEHASVAYNRAIARLMDDKVLLASVSLDLPDERLGNEMCLNCFLGTAV
jgi:hypothetical protein